MPNPAFARHWLLDPEVTYITHGTFGACPRPVLERQTQLRDQIEREPVRFLDYELEQRLDDARAPLAALIGGQPLDLVFVPNATTGVNTVLRSLDLKPGDEILATDHEYNACLNAARDVAERAGATVRIARIPFPINAADEVVDAMVAAAGPRTRVALYSHVTSPTALVFPVEQIAAALWERGIESLVDGAHAPGMVPIDVAALSEIGVAYYAGNCHKWLCAPKGAGFLWVRPDHQSSIRPIIVSHAANAGRSDRSYFVQSADWTGTMDPTPYLCVPAAIEFLGSLLPGGWPELMAANHRLALAARDVVMSAVGTPRLAPDDMIGAMAAIELPANLQPAPPERPIAAPPGSTYGPDLLHNLLIERERIEVPAFLWPPVPQDDRPTLRLLRVSAQVYNALADYERLAQALQSSLARPVAGGV